MRRFEKATSNLPKAMKAQVLDKQAPIETRPLVLKDMDLPRLGDDELLIRVSACGICRTDLHVVEGDLAQRRSTLIPGHQVVGKVQDVGKDVQGFSVGDRVGVAWLHSTCGKCRFCVSGRENLCEFAEFTGWTRNGGYAEYIAARADFVYPIPEGFEDTQAAPLLCAGIIGYRALRLTNISHWTGARLGIYGFGAAGHVCIQIARARGAQIYVSTRDRTRHQALAEELGATWVGDTFDRPPEKLDAAIIFAPAGEIIPAALSALDKGGTLVLGGIHMSPVPEFEYKLIYGERSIKSVANNTREDGRAFLTEAASVPVKTSVQTFDLDQANDALIALKNDAIKGAGVLVSS
jgi:propanol-preferring alcohol dehydrogenase